MEKTIKGIINLPINDKITTDVILNLSVLPVRAEIDEETGEVKFYAVKNPNQNL